MKWCCLCKKLYLILFRLCFSFKCPLNPALSVICLVIQQKEQSNQVPRYEKLNELKTTLRQNITSNMSFRHNKILFRYDLTETKMSSYLLAFHGPLPKTTWVQTIKSFRDQSSVKGVKDYLTPSLKDLRKETKAIISCLWQDLPLHPTLMWVSSSSLNNSKH